MLLQQSGNVILEILLLAHVNWLLLYVMSQILLLSKYKKIVSSKIQLRHHCLNNFTLPIESIYHKENVLGILSGKIHDLYETVWYKLAWLIIKTIITYMLSS